MLSSRFFALAFFSIVSSSTATAQAPVAGQSASPPQASATPSATDTSKPYIAVAAAESAEAAAESATAAPAVGESSSAAAPAKPAVVRDPAPTLTVNIDLAQQQMVVSENGAALYSWPISSGSAKFPTPRGTFRPQWSAKMWYSRKYDMAPMPHAVFIHGGVAVHGTQHLSRLGTPASHGCIRLAPGNARTFYNLVHKHGYKATRVAIHGTPKYSAPAIASRKNTRPQRYAVQQDSGWSLFGSSSYQPTSAYDPRFVKAQRKAAMRRQAQQPKRMYYYAANGQRVYVQRRAEVNSGW